MNFIAADKNIYLLLQNQRGITMNVFITPLNTITNSNPEKSVSNKNVKITKFILIYFFIKHIV